MWHGSRNDGQSVYPTRVTLLLQILPEIEIEKHRESVRAPETKGEITRVVRARFGDVGG